MNQNFGQFGIKKANRTQLEIDEEILSFMQQVESQNEQIDQMIQDRLK
jgi:hypothetical protein